MTLYEDLINELKTQLKTRNISFKKIFKLVCSEQYDKVIEIINDENLERLIVDIYSEIEKIGNKMENNLNNLLWLNDTLVSFGEKEQVSVKQARKFLKKNVFINIFDLIDERFEKRTTLEILRKDLKKNKERIFPKNVAKKYITLKCFLIKC